MTLRDGERRVVVNGIEHWCRVAGAANTLGPLIAIHGGPGGNHYTFERTIGPRLEEFSSVIYYEQRGCGRSESPRDPEAYSIPLLVEDLDQLRSALGVERFVPLGYSFGAELAAEYTFAHPDRVSRLILQGIGTDSAERAQRQLEGFLEVASDDVRARVARIVSGPGSAEEKILQVWDAVDSETVDRLLFRSSEGATLNRGLWRQSGLRNTGEMQRVLDNRAKQRESLRERLPWICVPTLVLVGRHDRNVGVSASREVADLIPEARLHVFEGSAHFPDIEEPETYARVVRGFIG